MGRAGGEPASARGGGVVASLADAPVLLRVPEGIKFERVAREGLGRLLCRPVRMIADGDRLVPGHVHLLHDGQVPWVEQHGAFARLREHPLSDPPGSWCAQMTVLARLAASPVDLRLVLPEGAAPDREEFLASAQGRHELFRLASPGLGSAGAREIEKGDDERPMAS